MIPCYVSVFYFETTLPCRPPHFRRLLPGLRSFHVRFLPSRLTRFQAVPHLWSRGLCKAHCHDPPWSLRGLHEPLQAPSGATQTLRFSLSQWSIKTLDRGGSREYQSSMTRFFHRVSAKAVQILYTDCGSVSGEIYILILCQFVSLAFRVIQVM